MGAKWPTSFRISDVARRDLKHLSRRLGITQASVVELSIRLMRKSWEENPMTPQVFSQIRAVHANLGAVLAAGTHPAVPTAIHEYHAELGDQLAGGLSAFDWERAWQITLQILQVLGPLLAKPAAAPGPPAAPG